MTPQDGAPVLVTGAPFVVGGLRVVVDRSDRTLQRARESYVVLRARSGSSSQPVRDVPLAVPALGGKITDSHPATFHHPTQVG